SLKIGEQWNQRTDYGNGFKEYEVLPTTSWNYALVLDKSNPESSIVVNKAATMPANPFVQATTPVTLTVNAKKLPAWGYSFNGIIACDPPYSPVETTQATEQITMVPFGAENIRATCLPVTGTPSLNSSQFQDNFSNGNQLGWVNYNGSFMVDNGEYFSTNIEGGNKGAKSVQSSTLFSDFTYDVKVQVGTSGDGGVMFRASKVSMGADEYNGYYVGISASGQNVVLGKGNGGWTSLRTAAMAISANTWYQLRVVAQGTTIKVYVNDMTTPKITYTDASFATGAVGVRCYNAITRWDNISVTSSLVSAVKDLKTTENIKVYPNPAKNFLEVSFNERLNNDFSIHILSINGSLIQTKKRSKDVAMVYFDTQNMAKGTYLVNISSDNESYQSRFIKE
ncbi:MAG TPA: family 16 glycoside hydrolase, partial [Paludibacter sp.]